MKLQFNPDSSYTFSGPAKEWMSYDSSFDTRRGPQIWGILDSNGTHYIHVSGGTFLPIQRRGDTSFVYMSTALLNVYLKGRLEAYNKHTTDYMYAGAAPFLMLVLLGGCAAYLDPFLTLGTPFWYVFGGAAALAIAFDGPVWLARRFHHHNMIKKGRSAEGYHEFAVNMRTGEIQIYKPLKS